MAALPKNLAIEQGATFRLAFTYCHAGVDDSTPGAPYNLTGCTARLQVRAKLGDEETILEASTGVAGGITLGGALGTVEIVFTDEKTEALGPLIKAVTGVYDLKLIWPSGEETRLLKGTVSVDPAVTWDFP